MTEPHEGIYTFIDCPDRKKTDLGTNCGCSHIYCCEMMKTGFCDRMIEVYPICANCEDGGDLTSIFKDDAWMWHCDSCGTERILTDNEIEILLGFGGEE